MKKLYFLFLFITLNAFSQNVTITKVIEAGCATPFVKTVELYVDGTVNFADFGPDAIQNTADDVVILNYMQNGGAWSAIQIDISGLGTITDSFVYIVRDIALMQAEFPSTTFNATNTVVTGTATSGDDGYQIVLNGKVVSQFGRTETDADAEDGTADAWSHSDAVATRKTGITDAGIWDRTQWDFTAEDDLDAHTSCQNSASTNLETYFATLGSTFSLGSGSGWTPTGAVCTTVLGSATAVCTTTTTGATSDTYSATVDFTGGNTGKTFVVTATSGTVGGDNPSSVESGTITITGITEGTNVTVTVTDTADGGVCDLSKVIESISCEPAGPTDLELRGVIDFGLGASDGKAIHLIATADIADLSEYGLGSASNGGGTDGQEFTFPAQAVSNGDNILLVRNAATMEVYLTPAGYALFDVIIEDTAGNAVNGNGNDAMELFRNGSAIAVDTFGDINDGVATSWNYEDSWAYKTTLGASWPATWIYGTPNCTDNTTTIFEASCVYPFVASLSTDNTILENVGVYPNPVPKNNNFITISSNSSNEMQAIVYNILGKQVLKQVIKNNKLTISELPKGLYLIKIIQENKETIKKIVIQ